MRGREEEIGEDLNRAGFCGSPGPAYCLHAENTLVKGALACVFQTWLRFMKKSISGFAGYGSRFLIFGLWFPNLLIGDKFPSFF